MKSTIKHMEAEIMRSTKAHLMEDNFVDDEADGSRRHSIPKKCNNGKKLKQAWINKLQSDIRIHTMYIMECDNKTDPYPPPHLPEQVKQFIEGDLSVGPSRANFVVDLANSSASAWNKKIGTIFTDDFAHIGISARTRWKSRNGFKHIWII
ncbi:hypothetical protein K439DRAFT_554443 [Ramaria rubella]|nr:hypothetical protein K439DRAFT_554443 [Ramaria rubella]